jgi:hypothetical protein
MLNHGVSGRRRAIDAVLLVFPHAPLGKSGRFTPVTDAADRDGTCAIVPESQTQRTTRVPSQGK